MSGRGGGEGVGRVRAGREALERLSSDPGLCATCVHLQLVASKRSVFVRCGRSDDDPAFPRYPPLPVRACRGHEPAEP